ncbi:MAG: GTP-binding protein [Oscillospiraceae bacterium]|nr:GTP-binding protein [Oscillospiraceae bacterium]MDY5095573.1 GTP-binding protein [Oscillospiraceae bacterium]
MTKIDIFSGFLGAGKTTLIKKLIAEAFQGEQIVLIENEFGEIGIDGGFLKEAGIQITEMNSGCICCSLVGDFRAALKKVVEQYHPDRILIEPSGVGKLSDVTRAVETIADEEDVKLNSFVTVADVNKVRLYMKNFGEFYNDQVSHASTILLSRTGAASEEKIEKAVAMLREKNPKATIVTTDWNQLTGAQILKAMESEDDFVQALLEQARQTVEEHEHHHHYDENGVCSCGHHHDEDEDEHDHEHEHHHDHGEEEHEHHHHDHDECGCDHDHEHEHHHDHDGACSCGCGHDHHHHHADEVFTSWGKETARKYTEAELNFALESLDSGELGAVLRAKGIVPGTEGQWFHFDYVPGEHQVRTGTADVTGRLCVIGSKLDEKALDQLFKL